MRSLLRSALLLALFLPSLAGATAPKVMPVGDSITLGYNTYGGYRYPSYTALDAVSKTINLVGDQTQAGDTTLPVGDRGHEGFSGKRTDEILALMANGSSLSTYTPEVVVILAGTNDILQGHTVAATATGIGDLINAALAQPTVEHVIVGTITPLYGSIVEGNRVTLDTVAIPNLVANEQALGHPVTLWDAASSVVGGTSDFSGDNIHPSATGYAKIGASLAVTLAALDLWPSPPSPPVSRSPHYKLVELTLASATLSGGAQIKAASGDLPQRIVCEDDVVFNGLPGASGTYGHFIVDPDGTHIWASDLAGGKIRKIDSADSSIDQEIVLADVRGVARLPGDNTHFWGWTYTNKYVKRYHFSDGGKDADGTYPASGLVIIPTAEDLAWYWAGTGTGTLTEFVPSTGNGTGRTIAGTTSDAVTDGTNIYVYNSSAVVTKYDLATLTLQSPTGGWTLTLDTDSWPGHGSTFYEQRRIAVDPSGGVYIGTTAQNGHIDKLNAGGGTGAAAISARYLYGLPSLYGASALGYTYRWSRIAWSDDSSHVWFPASDGTANSNGVVVRRKSIVTNRARWSQAIPAGETLKRIELHGDLAAWRDASIDMRKVRLYYSTDGGSTRTEAIPGAELTDATVAGKTLTVDVDMIPTAVLMGPSPWVAKPVIITDDGGAAVEIRMRGYDSQAARTVYWSAPSPDPTGTHYSTGNASALSGVVVAR